MNDQTLDECKEEIMTAPAYIEIEVATALTSSPELTALCAGRVCPLKLPQEIALPAVTYQRTASSPDYTLQGYGSENVTLTVNSYAPSYAAAKNLALAVRKTMAEAPLHAIFINERDLINETGDVFCVSAEYRLQQKKGYCYG